MVQRLVQARRQQCAACRFHIGYREGLDLSASGVARVFGPDGVITIANAKTYVHLSATREWALVQDQATDGISGAHFVSDFSENRASG